MPEPVKPPAEYKPPASEEEEKLRFSKFLEDFLEEDDAPSTNQQPPSHPPISSSSSSTPNIAAQINAALDARDKDKKNNEALENLTKEVAALKLPKRKKWWEPWSLFSDS